MTVPLKPLLAHSTSSFTQLLQQAAPELLPGRRPAARTGPVPHGTTIVALSFRGGALLAGDRRETMGHMIGRRGVRKISAADAYTLVGAAGVSGLCAELVRLYQLELEHYEKIEGAMLSLPAKANRLAGIVRGNLDAALRGLVVVPLLAGFDLAASDPERAGRIFSYDVAGSSHEETDFTAVGSGSTFARAALKKRYQPGGTVDEAVRLAMEALYDAADDDTATGGPDLARGIYPVVLTATAEGTQELPEAATAAVVEAVVAARREHPGG